MFKDFSKDPITGLPKWDLSAEPKHDPVTAPKAKIPASSDNFGKSAKSISPNFASQANPKDDEDGSVMTSYMLLSMFAAKKSDENGDIEVSSITNFVDMLEKVGVNVAPLKKIIEDISGKSYADLTASSRNSSDHEKISFAGFLNGTPGRGSYAPGPLIHNGNFDSSRVIQIAQSDDAGAGHCAKGVANILQKTGFDVSRGDATHWDSMLAHKGWKELNVDPAHAPVGAVLVFKNNEESGKGVCNNGHGAQYGHVEIVAEENGHKVFVSDAVRNNWGGSVKNNDYAVFVPPNANTMAMNTAPAPSPHHGPSLHLG